MTLLSICIPTYNRSRLLRRHLEHLERFKLDVEIVVADNCSSDDTPELAKEFARRLPRFRYVRIPRRVNPALCWDASLRAGNGEALYALGDDDLACEEGLAQSLEVLRARSSVKAVFGAQELRRLDNDEFIRHNVVSSKLEIFNASHRQLLTEKIWALEFPVILRDLYHRSVLCDGYSRFMLWSFIEPAFRQGEIAIAPFVQMYHYIHSARMTHDNALNADFLFFNAVTEPEFFISGLDCDQATKSRLISWQLASWYEFYAGVAMTERKFCGARLLIKKGLAHDAARFSPLATHWEDNLLAQAMVEAIGVRVRNNGPLTTVVVEESDISAWLATALEKALDDLSVDVVVQAGAQILSRKVEMDEFAVFKSFPEGSASTLLRDRFPGRFCVCLDLLNSLRLTDRPLDIRLA